MATFSQHEATERPASYAADLLRALLRSLARAADGRGWIVDARERWAQNHHVASDPGRLLEKPLKLAPEARAALAASLIESLDAKG